MGVQISFDATGVQGIKVALARFDRVNHAHDFFDKLADWIAEREASQFKSEGKTYPPKWAKLSPAYAKRKARIAPGKKILNLTGELEKSLTRRPFGVEVIGNDSMTIGTGIPYAIYHQEGTKNMPARPPLIRLNRSLKDDVRVKLQKWIINEGGGQ